MNKTTTEKITLTVDEVAKVLLSHLRLTEGDVDFKISMVTQEGDWRDAQTQKPVFKGATVTTTKKN